MAPQDVASAPGWGKRWLSVTVPRRTNPIIQ